MSRQQCLSRLRGCKSLSTACISVASIVRTLMLVPGDRPSDRSLDATPSRLLLAALASPAMGHWGTCPPPLDFQLVILGITRFTDSDENVQKQRIFAQFLSIFGPFLSFFCPQFSSGSNYSSQNAGTLANKFRLTSHVLPIPVKQAAKR